VVKMTRREKQTLTTKDVGVIKMGKDGKITVGTKKKCSICNVEYSMYDSENPKLSKRRKPYQLLNEWTEDEEVAHKISHVESPKSRRAIAALIKLSDVDREEVLSFISEHYVG